MFTMTSETGRTQLCDWIFHPAKNITMHIAQKKHILQDFLVILKHVQTSNVSVHYIVFFR